ncbi:TetR/AcrR family transcriptional regulator [Microbispora oryzae]|uniref:TetR/AcrR family transcriptional regulator n=1 Tax=Microbispora oryzae TaxID=2806554 RepID=UPI0027DD0660|nr:TetR/AcrR family transcriptional regulator [Microbispora oryzae]
MDTVERLIESTRELLWERGYTGTSPRAILERAGVGQGSMYHHFDGKADLAQAAIERTTQELRTEVGKLFAGPGPALDRITTYLRRERDVLKGCPIGRLTQDPDVVTNPDLRRPVDETFAWLKALLTAVLTDGQNNGELDASLDPAATASTIIAVMQGGYVLARAGNDPAYFDQAMVGVVALLDRARTDAGRAS